MAGKTEYMFMREYFRSTFPWNRLKRDGFVAWARKERNPPVRVSAHWWRPMRDGEPTPRAIVEAFAD